MSNFFSNTTTLTGRLALFFAGMSCVIGIVTVMVFDLALQWSEDRVSERRILIDRDSAIERFLAGEQGQIRLDALTTAYSDMALIPEEYRSFLDNRQTYVGEVDSLNAPNGPMVYKGFYQQNDQLKPLVLLSQNEKVEFSNEESFYAGAMIVGFVSALMITFGVLLYRLSKHLIKPVNHLTVQLNAVAGDPKKVFEINNDAAEEFQLLTARLNQYRSELDQALKREQVFARYASHELRTPLTVVKGANKLLSRSKTDDYQKRQVYRIENATESMITMVDALLSIVRYERNVNDVPTRVVDKNEIESMIAANSAQAAHKALNIQLQFDSQPTMKASPAVLNIVLGNLIRNAVSATKRGNIDIEVSSEHIAVIDDGPGLVTAPDAEGHGLGLLIVYDLCRRYQWQFSLTNHVTRGCKATIKFDPD